MMRVSGVELRWVNLPLVSPFRTAYGVEADRTALLLKVVTPDSEGWGECVAMSTPQYYAEYIDDAVHVLQHYLIPLLNGNPDVTAAAIEGSADATVHGHQMAKAALQAAIMDAQLRAAGVSLASHLDAQRRTIPAGVSVGMMGSVDQLLAAVAGYLDDRYQRIKLKIEPGWDIEPVRAVRQAFGGDVPLQVDGNGAYTQADLAHLAKLDEFGLLMIEQPFPEDDLLGHAMLTRLVRTPVCLDEPIVSVRAAVTAIELGAASIINIKPGRVGGLLESRRIHDACAARGVPVWIGGMLETGIGRAANIALAALPNCTFVGDVSASDRYFTRDITPHFTIQPDGTIEVPRRPGIGVDPDPAALAAATVSTQWIPVALS